MRRKREPWVLTERGQRLAAALWTVAVMVGTTLFLLGALGFAGWIEGLN